eukprot:404897-Rhodomonas_salina.1
MSATHLSRPAPASPSRSRPSTPPRSGSRPPSSSASQLTRSAFPMPCPASLYDVRYLHRPPIYDVGTCIGPTCMMPGTGIALSAASGTELLPQTLRDARCGTDISYAAIVRFCIRHYPTVCCSTNNSLANGTDINVWYRTNNASAH